MASFFEQREQFGVRSLAQRFFGQCAFDHHFFTFGCADARDLRNLGPTGNHVARIALFACDADGFEQTFDYMVAINAVADTVAILVMQDGGLDLRMRFEAVEGGLTPEGLNIAARTR